MSLFDSYMYPALFLSLIGLGLFLYGRKAPSLVAGIGGILLMVEPCVMFGAHLLWGVGLVTTLLTFAGIFLTQRRALDPTA